MKKQAVFIRAGILTVLFLLVLPLTSDAQSAYLEVRRLASKQELDTKWKSSGGSHVVTESTVSLELTIRNMSPTDEHFRVEWYFIAETLDGKTRVAYDKGVEELSFKAGEAIKLNKTSKPLKISKVDFHKWGSRERGAKMEGYIVLVKSGEKLVTSKTSSHSLDELVSDPEKLSDLIKSTEHLEKRLEKRELRMQRPAIRRRNDLDFY